MHDLITVPIHYLPAIVAFLYTGMLGCSLPSNGPKWQLVEPKNSSKPCFNGWYCSCWPKCLHKGDHIMIAYVIVIPFSNDHCSISILLKKLWVKYFMVRYSTHYVLRSVCCIIKERILKAHQNIVAYHYVHGHSLYRSHSWLGASQTALLHELQRV